MKSDFGFLPDSLIDAERFQKAFDFAVTRVRNDAENDLTRSVSARLNREHGAVAQTFGAASLLRDELESGAFGGQVPASDFARDHGFSDSDVRMVSRFLHMLRQQMLLADQKIAPGGKGMSRPKMATRTAAYFAGRLCAEFGLPRPTDYVSKDHDKASVAARLMNCLLVEAGADYKPSDATLRRGMAIAREGFDALNERKA